jgi:hypothetical protein
MQWTTGHHRHNFHEICVGSTTFCKELLYRLSWKSDRRFSRSYLLTDEEEMGGRSYRRIPHIRCYVSLRNDRLKLGICYVVVTAHVRLVIRGKYTGEAKCIDEICSLLGYYTALSDRSVPTFRDNISVPSSWTSWPLKMGLIGCPETSLQNYHPTLRNIPQERRSHLHRGGSLESRNVYRWQPAW